MVSLLSGLDSGRRNDNSLSSSLSGLRFNLSWVGPTSFTLTLLLCLPSFLSLALSLRLSTWTLSMSTSLRLYLPRLPWSLSHLPSFCLCFLNSPLARVLPSLGLSSPAAAALARPLCPWPSALGLSPPFISGGKEFVSYARGKPLQREPPLRLRGRFTFTFLRDSRETRL